jgi:hypothetical protein
MVQRMATKLTNGSVEEFLRTTAFLDLQESGKSQGAMLAMLDAILTEHKFKVAECGGENPSRYLYLDDVLCTGNTLFFNMKHWWDERDEKGTPRSERLPKDVVVKYVSRPASQLRTTLSTSQRRSSISLFRAPTTSVLKH